MKRFYKLVSIEKNDDGYHVLLDNRPVKTKSGAFLCACNEEIASRIMQEWAAQEDNIIPDMMPFTQILNTKIDRVSHERDAMTKAILKYLDTDLLCYRASEPEQLASLQQEKWQPWLDWFRKYFGHQLETTTALSAITHPLAAHEVVKQYVENLDDEYFTILQLMTSVSGSLILALAVVKEAATAQQVFEACFVEEDFKSKLYDAEKYGIDPMLEKMQKSTLQDFKASEDYIALLP